MIRVCLYTTYCLRSLCMRILLAGEFIMFVICHQCKKICNIFTGTSYRLLLSFTVISDVYKSFIPHKTTFTKYCPTQWISKLWNPLSKTVPGKFHGSGGQSKPNCLKGRVNFHRSRAWQLPNFNTVPKNGSYFVNYGCFKLIWNLTLIH